MLIQEIKVLRGPNFWSTTSHHLIQLLFCTDEFESYPQQKIEDFFSRLHSLMPAIELKNRPEHWLSCSIKEIILQLQELAGIKNGFSTIEKTKKGSYHIVFEYGGEKTGIHAAKSAVKIATALLNKENYSFEEDAKELKNLWFSEKLGPSTGSLVEEAIKRDIPYIRLDEGSLVQLGYGAAQKRVEATITSNTGSIGVDIAGNKHVTKKLLSSVYAPVPKGEIVSDVNDLKSAIDSVEYPIVIKPLDGNHGKGATINITSYDVALVAFERAHKYSKRVIVEKYICGHDFRVLLVNYKFIAAALRTPALVVGDGKHTIAQLIEKVNCDPKRGNGHENVLTAIKVDDFCLELLAKNGYTLQTVLAKGEECYLQPTANLSTGGTATDVTDEVHSSNISLFERVARTVGLDVCGIDVMAMDLSTPIKENGGVILEVNAAPGFRMHLEPTVGKSRNVAEPVIDMLFKNGNGRIPIVAITGTNGKTTTTRLVAKMAQQGGYNTGYTTTDGIYINNELITKGDCSGPASAKVVLKDSLVEFAVLETARGGLLRSGLGFDKCNTAIVTNVAEDHLGLDGIDTLEKLAKVKSIITQTVIQDGYAILNADDDLVYAMQDNLSCNIALFSMYGESMRIERHCNAGGLAAYYENGYILIRKGNQIIPVEEVKNVPITFDGKAEFNIANALAASLAAYTNNISLVDIRKALRSLVPSVETTPGRVNIYEFSDFTLVLDYAHNPHGVKALGKFIKSFDATVKVGVIAGVGDRRDEDITALGEEAAKIFDEIIIRHDDDLRGRTPEELNKLLSTGVYKVDSSKPITIFPCELKAVEHAIINAKPKSVVVVLIDKIQKVTEVIKEHQRMDESRILTMKTAV